MDKSLAISKFRLNLYDLETLLSMAPLYDLSTEALRERLLEINKMLEVLDKTYNIDAVSWLDEMSHVKSAFKNNNITLYSPK